jgi:hypothetical protein
MDLTRHSDKELSYRAKQVLNRIDIHEYLVQQLQSTNRADRANAEKVLFKLDKAEAMKVSSKLGPTRSSELASRLESRGNAPQVLPTASPQGDRYYVKATWDPRNPSVVECLTGLFSRELISNRSLDQERSLMKNRSERLVYWYDKEWSVEMSRQIKSCGGTATFVHAPSGR